MARRLIEKFQIRSTETNIKGNVFSNIHPEPTPPPPSTVARVKVVPTIYSPGSK